MTLKNPSAGQSGHTDIGNRLWTEEERLGRIERVALEHIHDHV